MASLVGYESSGDDQDDVPTSDQQQRQQPPPKTEPPTSRARLQHSAADGDDAPRQTSPPCDQGPLVTTKAEPPVPHNATLIGPSLPPPQADYAPLQDDNPDHLEEPQSPYSAERALIHDLTLPAYPDLDIPPSPPGSPPVGITKKFEQFLALKQKGVHLNAKLEESTVLRNPGVMDKLLDFVELEGAQQYETTLSLDLWNPSGFPESARVNKLKKLHEGSKKSKARQRPPGNRTSISFVPASTQTLPEGPLTGGLTRKQDETDAL
ncbi:hypothetical protein CDD82_3960 [Ophiocordyceps australis]|uniref:HCNGP-like protein n=1 Tax=Ophiocordyceps australis TaxID=1399860 RepID=A0A2C5Z9P8_9HYPO|nr:hypothetical protein CDD82_3960 [Ophiocordyceps australis]